MYIYVHMNLEYRQRFNNVSSVKRIAIISKSLSEKYIGLITTIPIPWIFNA